MDTWYQQTLADPPIEAYAIQCLYEGHMGWHLRIAARPEGGSWADLPAEVYDGLSLGEMIDSLVATLDYAGGRRLEAD